LAGGLMAVWKIEPDVDITVEIGPGGPFDNPSDLTNIDVTAYVEKQGITITRGRSDEFQAFQAGSCSFSLRNDGRQFDPSWTGAVGEGIIDGGDDTVPPIDILDAGGTPSPPADALDSIEDSSGLPFAEILKPLRRVQVIATYQGIRYPLFVGYIDGWPRTWTKTTGSVPITAKDALSVMARALVAPSRGVFILDHPIQGRLDANRLSGDLPEQFTGERISSLIQLAGFSEGSTAVLDTGITRVLGIEPTGNVLQSIQQAEVAEAGFFFVSSDGVIRFHDRHSRFQKPRTANVQALFTDDQYSGLEIDQSLSQVWNDVEFTRPLPEGVDEEPPGQRFINAQSQHDFGIISYEQEIPVLSDGETLGRAEFWVMRYGQPQDRPSPIVIKPRRDMAILFPACAGMELLDRIRIQRTPLGVGPATTFTGLVEQVEHRITNENWETTLAISPIDISEGADFLILDDPLLGNLDDEVLAF
jgi:hypothetical protein